MSGYAEQSRKTSADGTEGSAEHHTAAGHAPGTAPATGPAPAGHTAATATTDTPSDTPPDTPAGTAATTDTPTATMGATDPRHGTAATTRTAAGAATAAGARDPAEAVQPAGHPLQSGPQAVPRTGTALTAYLQAHATEFLRSLRLHRESGGTGSGGGESAEAARALHGASHRIGGALHTFRALLDPEWSDALRAELAWLSVTLGREHASAARLARLLSALHRLSGAATVLPAPREPSGVGSGRPERGAVQPHTGTGSGSGAGVAGRRTGATGDDRGAVGGGSGAAGMPRPATGAGEAPTGTLTIGAAKAGALLERQLTLAKTRAHSTALQALGSSRFHAVADRVAVLASEVPLAPGVSDRDLAPLAAEAKARLAEAVAALPLYRAGHPYNADALLYGLAAEPAPPSQDAPWHHVRLLLRLHRHAREVLAAAPTDHGAGGLGRGAAGGAGDGGHGTYGGEDTDVRLADAGRALDRHRDAAEAAAAAASAARTPRIAPATAYALGVLHADQRHEVEAARFAFQDIWLREAVSPR